MTIMLQQHPVPNFGIMLIIHISLYFMLQNPQSSMR